MADITLTTTESNIVVDASNNIIQVSSTPTTIVVAEGSTVDNAQIRSALSNVAPILYDVSTGVFSFDANATFSGKTTDDLAEGTTNLYFTAARARGNVSATTATGISYNSGTGVFSLSAIPNSSLTNSAITINGTSVSLGGTRTLTTTDIGEGTNLYFTAARARGNVSAVDAGGLGSFTYSSASGAFTYTGPSDSDVRSLVSAANTTTGHGNISYSNSTGVITFDRVTGTNIRSEIPAGNVKLKQYSETVFNAGNQSGNVTLDVANGSIQKLDLVGNVTGLAFTNITAGSTVSLILRQDAIGFRRLNTTLFASNWTTWDFVGDHTTLTVDPLAYDILTVTYDGTNYFASLVNFNTPVIQNSQLANSNVIVNGVTIALGSSGNIDTFNSNVTVNGNLNVTGNLNYQNVTDLYVTDQKITLNSNAATNANVEIISNRPTATNTMLKWNEQSTHWEFTNDGTTYYAIATSTTDLAEGSNLWFTTARANSAIDNRLVGGTGISYTAGTVAIDFTEFDTGNITEGANLYYTTDRANTAIGAYQGSINTVGNISTTANITAGNVITTNIHTNGGTSLTLNANTNLVVRETIKGVSTNVGNISGDGYALFTGQGGTNRLLSHTGASEVNSAAFKTGNTTSGSNVITNVTLVDIVDLATPISVSAITQYYAWDYNFGSASGFPFPPGTYVTSVDSANSTITLNNPAAVTVNLDQSILLPQNIVPGLAPGAFDANTGLLLGLINTYAATGSGSKTTLAGQILLTQGRYGYPATGPAPTDFVYSIDTASDYTLSGLLDTDKLIARTQLEAPKTVMAAPRGLIVGNGDLTNRAENDGLQSFGINVLWDGLAPITQYADGTPLTQILVKNYTTNNLQSTNRSAAGPRIMFTAAEGNKNQSYVSTYPRKDLELGRVSWFGLTQADDGRNLSTTAPPAWISGVAGNDHISYNSGIGMYFANSPNINTFDRSLYLGSSKGSTLIASSQDSTAAQQPIIFAPSHIGSNQGNAVLLYNQTVTGTDPITDTVNTSGAHFAQINYANTTGLTGAKVSVTNGNNFATVHEGNIVLSLDRNSNSANANVRVRTGATNYNGSLNPDRVRFTFAPEGLVDGTAVIIRNFTQATVAAALNGNVFYVKRNDSAGYVGYDLYTDSGLTTAVNLGVGNVQGGPGTFEYTRTNSVTAKEWTMVLAQGSNDLVLAEDGVTRTTFASGGNVSMNGNLTITGRHTYDRVYGEFFSNVDQTAANTTSAFAITLNNTGISSGTSIVDNSNITIAKAGIYNIQFSVQLSNGHNAEEDFDIWLRKNGTNVPNTNTQFTVTRDRSGNPGKSVAALNLLVDAAAGDVYQLMWAVTNTLVTIEAIPEQAAPYARPATPSVIVTVTPVGA